MKTTCLAFAIALTATLCAATLATAAGTVTREEVRQLAGRYYANAVAAHDAGKLEPARHLFQAALRLEPSHAKAKAMLQIVEQKLGITAGDKLNEKLGSRIPRVEFDKAELKEVVKFLAREADVNMVFHATALSLLAAQDGQPAEAVTGEETAFDAPGEDAPARVVRTAPVRSDLITIRLSNVPLREVLRYVLRLKGLRYVVEEYAILIVPINWIGEEDLVTEIFRLRTSGSSTRQITEYIAGIGAN